MADNRKLLLKRKQLLERKKQLLQQQAKEKPKEPSTLAKIGKFAITPLLKEKTITGTQVGRAAAQTFPINVPGISPIGGFPIPPQYQPEAVAKVVSPMTSPVGILSSLLLFKRMQRIGELPIYPGRHIPQVMDKNYTMTRAQKGVNVLEKIRSKLGKAKEELLNDIGEKAVDAKKLSKNFPTLPKTVSNKLNDPIYGIEKLPDGSIKPTIKNLDRVKTALGDQMTGAQWEEATTMIKQRIKQAYGAISRSMVEADPKIARPLERYHKFMRYFYNDINKTLRDTQGRVLEKKVRTAFSPGAERRFTRAWERLGKADKQASQIVKDLTKFTSRQILKKNLARVAWRVAPWAIGYGVLRNMLGGREEVGGGG